MAMQNFPLISHKVFKEGDHLKFASIGIDLPFSFGSYVFTGIGPEGNDEAAALAFAARVCYTLYEARSGSRCLQLTSREHWSSEEGAAMSPQVITLFHNLVAAWDALKAFGESSGYVYQVNYEGSFGKARSMEVVREINGRK